MKGKFSKTSKCLQILWKILLVGLVIICSKECVKWNSEYVLVISSPLIWLLFIMLQKILFLTSPSLEILLKYFLILSTLKIFLNTFFSERCTFVLLYFALFTFFLVGFLQNYFLAYLWYISLFSVPLFIKGTWFLLTNLSFKDAWHSTILMKVSVMKR